jgi:hypothetical protein
VAQRDTPVNPAGFLATQDLKDRGWTPALIRRFLGEHDRTRPNGLRMGRRRLPPVKLYEEARVLDVERDDTFLAAQARAADARERAEQTRAARALARQELLTRAAAEYVPVIHPEPLRRGAVRKAREPYQGALEARLDALRREIPKLTAREESLLTDLLRSQLDRALHAAYPWYPSPDARPVAASSGASGRSAAKASDWREWDWD